MITINRLTQADLEQPFFCHLGDIACVFCNRQLANRLALKFLRTFFERFVHRLLATPAVSQYGYQPRLTAMITWFVSSDYLFTSIRFPKIETSKVFTLEATVRPKIGLSRRALLCWSGDRFGRPGLKGRDAEHMGVNGTSLQPALIQGERPSDYAGDVTVDEAWRVLLEDKDSVLIDVRTNAEWS